YRAGWRAVGRRCGLLRRRPAWPASRRGGDVRRGVRDPMRAPFRVVVITGASSGLGAALALLYAGPGVAMGLVGRDPERLAASAAACRAAGATVESAMIDVADGRALAGWLETFDESYPVELLIANAGTSAGPD